jgi:hypothetical protein
MHQANADVAKGCAEKQQGVEAAWQLGKAKYQP